MFVTANREASFESWDLYGLQYDAGWLWEKKMSFHHGSNSSDQAIGAGTGNETSLG